MFKRIFYLVLLGLLAWFLKPVLEVILPLPTEKMMSGLLDLSTDKGRDWLTIWRFLVWIIALALIIRFAKPVLSFVLPTAKRYGVTKPMRRFQGVFAEVFLFGLVFLVLGVIVASIGSAIQFQNTLHDRKLLVRESLVELKAKRKREKDSAYSIMSNASRVATELMMDKKYTHDVPNDIWPCTVKKGLIAYHLSKRIPNCEVKTDYETYYKELLRVVDSRDRYWYEKRHGQNELIYDLPNDNEATRSLKWKYREHLRLTTYRLGKPKITLLPDYTRLLQTYNSAKPKYDEAYVDYIDIPEQNTDEFIILERQLAREDVWKDFGSLAGLMFSVFKRFWILVTIVSAVGYGLTHFIDRAILGRYYTRFLRVIEQGRFGLGGSARFAGLFEEWAVLFRNQTYGLFMGRSLYNPYLSIGLEDPRHMITVAGSRAGKGATAIIPNLLLWEGSALVIDPKGSNAAVTARRREEMGQKVHYVDPFNILGRDDTASFNPLSILDPNAPSIREQVNIIAEALVVQDPNQRDKHWDEGAKTIIAGLIGHLISSPKYIDPTLPMVRELISCMPDEQIELWADMSLNDGAGRLAKDAGNRIIRGAGTNETAGILSNADKHTEWLSSPAMVKMLSTTSFNFAELKDEPTTVYLILPPEYLETHKRFLRLFINLMITQMSVGGKAKVPVLMIMDEFLALGRMEEVEKAYGLMAGYNLILWPFIQDLGRLQDMYGKSVNAFIANSRAVQVFGVADEETKAFISKYIGDRTLNHTTSSKDQGYNNVVNLRNPTEVAIDIAADTNRQYILRSGKAPLIIEKVPYYTNQKFQGLFDPDPDYEG